MLSRNRYEHKSSQLNGIRPMNNANRRRFLTVGIGALAVTAIGKPALAGGHAVLDVEICGGKFSPDVLRV